MESIVDATERSIRAATHLTEMDAAAVAALRVLAARMASVDLDRDNVTVPTFLKYCAALKLTPEARGVEIGESAAKGKLAQMRLVKGGRSGAVKGEAG